MHDASNERGVDVDIDESWHHRPPLRVDYVTLGRVESSFNANVADPKTVDHDHRIATRWGTSPIDQHSVPNRYEGIRHTNHHYNIYVLRI